MLSRNCVEFQALYFAAGRAGLVTQPLNWRLAGPALQSVVKDAAPKVVIGQAEFRDGARGHQALGRRTALAGVRGVVRRHPGRPDPAVVEPWRSRPGCADHGRRPVLPALHRRHHGRVQGSAAHPPQRGRRHAQPDRRRADRARRRLHADRADVPHPRRARDELHEARLPAGADELRAQARPRPDREREGLRLPRRHHDAELDDGPGRTSPATTSPACATSSTAAARCRPTSSARPSTPSRAP